MTTNCAETVVAESNSIHTPNYPSTYNPNEECGWAITGPSGRQLKLTFNDFALEAENDILAIRDGHSKDSPIIKTFNGTSLPQDVISTGNSFFVEFNSDGQHNYHGFDMQYHIKGTLIQVERYLLLKIKRLIDSYCIELIYKHVSFRVRRILEDQQPDL